MATSGPWGRRETAKGQSYVALAWIVSCATTLAGFLQPAIAEGWTDQLVAGLMMMVGGPLIAPPMTRLIRARLHWARLPWVPVAYAIALVLGAQLVGSFFTPTGAQLAQLRASAIARSEGLLSRAEFRSARFELRRFRDGADPGGRVAATLHRIDVAEQDRAAAQAREEAQRAQASAIAAAVEERQRHAAEAAQEHQRQAEEQAETARNAALRAEGHAQTTILAALRERMNDPTSLDIVGQRILPEQLPNGTPVLRGYVVYRGTNAYGGVVTEQAILTLSTDGNRVITMASFPNGTF